MAEPWFPTAPLPPLLARLFRLAPLAPLTPPLALFARLAARSHPAIEARLGPYRESRFAIIATDLDCTFRLHPAGGPALEIRRGAVREGADAVIAGPILALIGLMLGRLDGDALFFSRTLTMEGDTAAALALRNALEEAELGRLPARLAASLPTPPSPFMSRRNGEGRARWS
jgi:predicted lipid carrier protein YhbT